MEYVKKFETSKLKYEYGLDGIRTFPWEGIVPPFGGGYCIVRPGTSTLNHVNIPDDEDEMFIACRGTPWSSSTASTIQWLRAISS